jgi:hypothetical protein
MEANGIRSAGGTTEWATLTTASARLTGVPGSPRHQDVLESDGGARASQPARRWVRAKNAGLGRLRRLRSCSDHRLMFGSRQASNLKCRTPLAECSYGSS